MPCKTPRSPAPREVGLNRKAVKASSANDLIAQHDQLDLITGAVVVVLTDFVDEAFTASVLAASGFTTSVFTATGLLATVGAVDTFAAPDTGAL